MTTAVPLAPHKQRRGNGRMKSLETVRAEIVRAGYEKCLEEASGNRIIATVMFLSLLPIIDEAVSVYCEEYEQEEVSPECRG